MNYSGHVDYANYVYLLLQFENPRSICCYKFHQTLWKNGK